MCYLRLVKLNPLLPDEFAWITKLKVLWEASYYMITAFIWWSHLWKALVAMGKHYSESQCSNTSFASHSG